MDRHGISSYDELLTRSVEDIAWFWDAVMEDLDIRFTQPYSQTVDLTDGAPFARWCIGGKMNIIHNCLDKYQASATASEPALIFEGEEGRTVTLTYAQLHQEVCRCANALRSLGIRSGDAVGLYMPLIPELAVAFLAVIKIGGTNPAPVQRLRPLRHQKPPQRWWRQGRLCCRRIPPPRARRGQ